MKNIKRVNFSIKKDVESALRSLANKTGLKMSTIVEKGILLFKKENEQGN